MHARTRPPSFGPRHAARVRHPRLRAHGVGTPQKLPLFSWGHKFGARSRRKPCCSSATARRVLATPPTAIQTWSIERYVERLEVTTPIKIFTVVLRVGDGRFL